MGYKLALAGKIPLASWESSIDDDAVECGDIVAVDAVLLRQPTFPMNSKQTQLVSRWQEQCD